jgi:hypothetical protein
VGFKGGLSEMGIDLTLFYVWGILSLIVLFCILDFILESFIPGWESFINKFKNYLKGGVL